jgi:hypothetical protein
MMTFGLLKWDFCANTKNNQHKKDKGLLELHLYQQQKETTANRQEKEQKGWSSAKEHKTQLAQTKKR